MKKSKLGQELIGSLKEVIKKQRKSKLTPEQRRDAWLRNQIRRITIRWPAAHKAKKAARVGRFINPTSGREAWHARCAMCNELFPESKTELDHTDSVAPYDGSHRRTVNGEERMDWNVYLERAFPFETGFRVLCKPCHQNNTNDQRTKREINKHAGTTLDAFLKEQGIELPKEPNGKRARKPKKLR